MSIAIVAIPRERDKTWEISSEKIPHMTLLFLGDDAPADELITVVSYVEHAAKELSPFGLSVDYRDTLGPEDADVLFFEKSSWEAPRISDFRHHLLLNDTIKKLYDSTEQFPEWTPHVTLGFPATPAKEDDDEDKGFYHVSFDRIAVWMGDYEGPTFRLRYDEDGLAGDVAWSDLTAHEKGEIRTNELFHHGVKGMRWGVRNVDRGTGTSSGGTKPVVVRQKKPGQYAKASGGEGHPIHGDAESALKLGQKAKKSTTDALSNQELRDLNTRLQLENQFQQLTFSNERRSKGARFVAGFFGNKKPTKYRDQSEHDGEQTRKVVDDIVAARQKAKN